MGEAGVRAWQGRLQGARGGPGGQGGGRGGGAGGGAAASLGGHPHESRLTITMSGLRSSSSALGLLCLARTEPLVRRCGRDRGKRVGNVRRAGRQADAMQANTRGWLPAQDTSSAEGWGEASGPGSGGGGHTGGEGWEGGGGGWWWGRTLTRWRPQSRSAWSRCIP